MNKKTEKRVDRKIAVIGLGYVGLPVAAAFGKLGPVVAYDKNADRIHSLQNNLDTTHEVAAEALQACDIAFSQNPDILRDADFYIVAVPTPVNAVNQPDLSLLFSATETIARYLTPGDIVVYESTVYPGATEEECAPILERVSGLECGQDFTVGYSPERINPGDKEHTLENITKVVAGQDEITCRIIAELYGKIIKAGIYCAPNIKTAEAAKVIENTQRDLNIALMNELAIIFKHMNLDTKEVLAAAATKWNFLPFQPGLVGGHCIGVDPYYLTHKAQKYGYCPEVILAGRRINDNVGKYIATQTIQQMLLANQPMQGATVGILGLTFKENCADLRNTRVIDIIQELNNFGISCLIHAPKANPSEARRFYNLDLVAWEDFHTINAFILAVPHQEFHALTPDDFKSKCIGQPIIIDVKSALDQEKFVASGIKIWRL